MKTAQLWFTVPQAVVLEATGDLEAVLDLTDDDLDLLGVTRHRLPRSRARGHQGGGRLRHAGRFRRSVPANGG